MTPQPNATPAWYPTLDLATDRDGSLKRAADACAKMVADMRAGATPYWLTLTGAQGCGKTMLAFQVFDQARTINPGRASIWIGERRRPRCYWYTEPDFADAIRTDTRLPEYLADDYLVLIDDLGTARERFEQVADALYRLANARLGKWTLWTSNLTHAEIADKIDQRLASRLIRDANTGVRITAPDYALRIRKLAA